LHRIVQASERCLDMVRMIATATEQQSTAMEEVSTTMENISSVAKTSQKAITQITSATNELSHLSGNLQGSIGWFKMNGKMNEEK